ncbi:HU family DNA-binding protein [Bacteroidota bacterium]
MAAKKPMTKTEVLSHLADKVGVTKKQAGVFMEELQNLAYKEAKNSFTLPGFGKLVVVDRKARMGRNPATGEAIKIPAKRVLKFRIAKACKDAVLPPKKK